MSWPVAFSWAKEDQAEAMQNTVGHMQTPSSGPILTPKGPNDSHVEVKLGHLLIIRDLDFHSCLRPHLRHSIPE